MSCRKSKRTISHKTDETSAIKLYLPREKMTGIQTAYIPVGARYVLASALKELCLIHFMSLEEYLGQRSLFFFLAEIQIRVMTLAHPSALCMKPAADWPDVALVASK